MSFLPGNNAGPWRQEDSGSRPEVVSLRTRCSRTGRCVGGRAGTGAGPGSRCAGELVLALRDDLDDEFLGDDFPAGRQPFVVGHVQLGHDAAGIRGVGGLQCLQGTVLGFLDVGTDFVVIGSRGGRSSFQSLTGLSRPEGNVHQGRDVPLPDVRAFLGN